MKTFTRLTALSFAVGFYVGCSPAKFDVSAANCNSDTSCIVQDGMYSYSYSITAGAGKVDILIVDDNSASMSFEQKRLAPRFANFIQNLDAKKIDYRIAITTTDVSGGSFPQGGKLITMGDGSSFITPTQPNRVDLFNNAIQRPETRSCENWIANYLRDHGASSINTSAYSAGYSQNCPSGDERGIYAANLVVQNNPNSFIRSDAHLSIIFLSDEDERSGLYLSTAAYNLASMDQPGVLTSNVRSYLGQSKYNSLSVHSIVVKDNSCLSIQNNQVLGDTPNEATRGLLSGSIGAAYLTFSQTNPAWGVAADICSSDYTTQLGQIQTNIESRIKDIMLKCSNPTDLEVNVSGSTVAHSVNGNVLSFNQYLAAGTSVSLSYKCSAM
ncbi:MAG: hypothetical protein ACM3MG_09505 [Bacillota bacterium]